MNARLKLALLILSVPGYYCTSSPAQAGDSVIIRVGKGSKVVFTIKDKRDLETLKHYNFQALMDDMVQKLENRDTTALAKPSSVYLKDSVTTAAVEKPAEIKPVERIEQDEEDQKYRKRWGRRTHHSFNIDVGMNNYLQNGKFPDGSNELYTVKPWGSWYVGLNSVLRTHVAGKLFMEWGGGVTWYNFKFSNTKVVMSKDDNGVIFSEDPRDFEFTKSKLTVAYINASIVPVMDFGGSSRKNSFFDHHHSNSFRVGFGPYVGYRLDSYAKQVHIDNGNKVKNHDHDNFYLNNMRYGLRLQLGFRGTDIFFNYDMNDLFIESKGPKLNAFSFGITL
jgi:hypothetical protein